MGRGSGMAPSASFGLASSHGLTGSTGVPDRALAGALEEHVGTSERDKDGALCRASCVVLPRELIHQTSRSLRQPCCSTAARQSA
jgi:hypothetical protein